MRIWVSLALVWMLGSSIFAYSTVFLELPNRQVTEYGLSTTPPYAVQTLDLTASDVLGRGHLQSERVDLHDVAGVLFYRSETSVDAVNMGLAAMKRNLDGIQQEADRSRLKEFSVVLAFSAIPPLVLLLMGIAVAWSALGFVPLPLREKAK